MPRSGSFQGIAFSFLFNRLALFGIGLFSIKAFAKGPWYYLNDDSGLGLTQFFRWDSGWYLTIVEQGYVYIPGQQSNVAFFPLYPLVVRLISYLTGHSAVVGFAVSNVCCLTALYFLYQFARLEFEDSRIAFRSVLLAMIFPAGFYHSLFYSDGMFLMLTAAALYFSRTRNWFIAGISGYLAALTRSVGVLIVVPMACEMLNLRMSLKSFKFPNISLKEAFCLLLPILGLATYLLYLFVRFGDPLANFHASKAWGKKLTLITESMKSVAQFPDYYKIFFFTSLVIAVVSIVSMIAYRFRLSLIAYSLCLLFIYLSSNHLEGVPRYISAIIPMYMSLACLSVRINFIWESVMTMFSLLLAVCFSLFVCGYWMV